MKIGILGSGNVGQQLARAFVSEGHDVRLGTRQPSNPELQNWAASLGPKVSIGMFGDAALFGELIVLATAWSGTENALWLADPRLMAGKIVIDATNPLAVVPGSTPVLALGFTDSGGEQVQRWIPDGKVVKCFNTVGAALMYKPQLPGSPPDMFLCGNDAVARKTVADICEAFGWVPVDCGGIEAARLLEPLAMLWIDDGFRTGRWTKAWKMLR